MSYTVPTTKKLIFDYIASRDTVSKGELLQVFEVTSSSLTRLLEEMTTEGILEASGFGNSTGGRKPILYRVNPSHRYIIGFEISRFGSSIFVFDLQLNRIANVRWKMDATMTPDVLIHYAATQIQSILQQHHIPACQVIGIGIGAVGPLDQTHGVILNPLHFPADGWKDIAICEQLTVRTGIPSFLENGANTALIGEHWALRGERIKHMLYVHAGVGLRSAMMSEGQIVRGAFDLEGSFGQMIIQTDGTRLQEEGNYGALEAYASIPALEKQVRTQVKLGRETMLHPQAPENIHFDMILHALNQGDRLVADLFHQTGAYLGIGLANLINVLHPERVILGGPLMNADQSVYGTVIQVTRKNIYYAPDYQPTFSMGILKEDAVATGAAVMVRKAWDCE